MQSLVYLSDNGDLDVFSWFGLDAKNQRTFGMYLLGVLVFLRHTGAESLGRCGFSVYRLGIDYFWCLFKYLMN